MQIKQRHEKGVMSTLRSHSVLKYVLLVVAFATYTLVTLLVGAVTYKSGEMDEWYSRMTSMRHAVRQMIALYRSRPESIAIDIKHKHFQKLAAKRENALRNGGMLRIAEDDYVPATIRLRLPRRARRDRDPHRRGCP